MITGLEWGTSRMYSENMKLIWLGVHELPEIVRCVCVFVYRCIFLWRQSRALTRFPKGVHELNHVEEGTEH